MYKKRSLKISETPVLYRGRTVPKGQHSGKASTKIVEELISVIPEDVNLWQNTSQGLNHIDCHKRGQTPLQHNSANH